MRKWKIRGPTPQLSQLLRKHQLPFCSIRMPLVLNPMGPLTFWVHCGVPFDLQREMLHVACYKVVIYFAKTGFVNCKWSNLNAPGSWPLGDLFFACRKIEMVHTAS